LNSEILHEFAFAVQTDTINKENSAQVPDQTFLELQGAKKNRQNHDKETMDTKPEFVRHCSSSLSKWDDSPHSKCGVLWIWSKRQELQDANVANCDLHMDERYLCHD
jgi:hypothetical protein